MILVLHNHWVQAPNSVPCNKWFNRSAISAKIKWIEIKYFILNWCFSIREVPPAYSYTAFFKKGIILVLRALSAFLMCGLLFCVCSTHEHTPFSSHVDLGCWKNSLSNPECLHYRTLQQWWNCCTSFNLRYGCQRKKKPSFCQI